MGSTRHRDHGNAALTRTVALTYDIQGVEIPPSVERYARNLDNTRNPGLIEDGVRQGAQRRGLDSDGVDQWFFKTGVSAKQDDVVQFLIVLNAGNQKDQTAISLKETLSPFVEYVSGSDFVQGHAEDLFVLGNEVSYEWVGLTGQEGLVRREAEIGPITIAKNTSIQVTYQVKVIGGDEAVLGGDGTTGGGGNNAEQQLSEAGAESIDGTFAEGTYWYKVVDAGEQENPGLQACWCKSGGASVKSCDGKVGWVVGPNIERWSPEGFRWNMRALANSDYIEYGAGQFRWMGSPLEVDDVRLCQ